MTEPNTDASTSPVILREALDMVPAYQPGKRPTPRPGVPSYKASSNENPYPPLPSVVAAVHQAGEQANRYPDMFCVDLTQTLADQLGVPETDIVVGTGSSGVLSQLINATTAAGDSVVYAWRSFEAYPIMVALTGARSIRVPLTADARHDLPAMAAAIDDTTRVVLVCTPNNPTGPAITQAELDDFVAQVPQRVLVVIDEAYLEFNQDPATVDGLATYRAHPNVMVLRTFSKAYGLAGLRVGYGVAHAPVAQALRKCAVPFGVSHTAQLAALASLSARDELLVRVKDIVAERDRVVAGLTEQGWDLPDTQANFVWLALGEQSADFAAFANEAGLSLRPFAGEGVRCSIDIPASNDLLLKVAGQWRKRQAAG
ncbi:MAG: histidinol-phosphate transaminase [Austwickia sp.]|nr:histidinol-phosphate transaminase [Austwickia sp.]MBK8437634.1 histidinol-phosphate transaminase [Austwickia sp.]MBK9102918.1 histidinol-phosphate transaminase [Austwickia sp.]